VKAEVGIPVIANGDITTPEKARDVLRHTGADGVMIGRAAQGRPWLFREIAHYLATGRHCPPAKVTEIHAILADHLEALYVFYGHETGVRVARKHIAWYTKGLCGSAAFRRTMNTLPDVATQRQAVDAFFRQLAERSEHLEYVAEEELAA
jgi:tRNA-dihydrouridine synthase B